MITLQGNAIIRSDLQYIAAGSFSDDAAIERSLSRKLSPILYAIKNYIHEAAILTRILDAKKC